MSKMTPVQKAALDLILDDVRFFYTYVLNWITDTMTEKSEIVWRIMVWGNI